ncbi:PepSY-associated TM helix domain-containing protein [Sandaracinobacteroides hominis]|uniref:PepSY-associated TM helix domain-containing protein n=1 Tax=Sandaracinobacteroides hominis TaxID=2780086 RepID=UPI0018F6491E|nr:PepSY-associated TM helix domain-containing protein [Sandaracinobacteroides hominis]
MNAPTSSRSWTPSPDFVRAVLKGHSGLGLAFAAAIYLVCLTGTLAVFANEFHRWENPGAPRMASVSDAAVQTAYQAAMRQAGDGVEHVYITIPSPQLPWLMVTADKGGELSAFLATENGELAGPAADSWTEFLTRLHVNLHLPRTIGLFIVGLTGVALLSSLISGILAHPRIFRDAFHLRLGGSRRLQEADLHNRIGVWALPFHVIVSLTGALLGLQLLIVGVLGLALFKGDTDKVYDLFLPPHPVDDARPAPALDLGPMFAQIRSKVPDGRVSYVFIEHPTEMGGAALFNVDARPDRLSAVDAYTFDRTGKLYYAKTVDDTNLGERILGALGPLHFGTFGGGLLKIVYGILGLGLSYLAVGGVLIWLARRRDKGRPAPGWEKVWTAVTWGQPLALAAAALAAVVAPAVTVSVLIGIWGGLTIATVAGARAFDRLTLSRLGRGLTGGLLVLTAILHIALHGSGDPMALVVNAVLLATGLGLVAPVWKGMRQPA